jgi:NADH-quinone oxidoreductase subunit N
MDIPASLSMLDIRPIVPELILICVGLVLMLLDLIVKKKETVAFMGIAGTLVALYATCKLYALDGTEGFFASMFVLDGYSSFFKLIFYLNVIMTICISLKYLAVEKASYGEYYALLLFATSGMMIMASAADLIVLYLGLELMALSTYILAGLIRTRQRSNEAALKYFFLGAFSSAFLLYGISLTYGLTGTTNLKEIASALYTLNINGNPVLFLGIIFIIVAFGFKIALVPFHMWAPDVYEGAPTSITAFMSVGPKAAGFAVLGRVLFDAFGGMQVQWSNVLIPLAVITMAVGSIIALAQTNIKRMLAYLMIYAFMNLGAFAIVIALRSEGFQGEDLDDYQGLAKTHPLASALMLIFMFSLTGIPPTAGFIGKFYVFMEVIRAGYTPLAIIAVVFSAISAFFYLRIVMYMYMKEPQREVVLTNSPAMSIALAFMSAMVLVLGVFPSLLLDLVRFSVLG